MGSDELWESSHYQGSKLTGSRRKGPCTVISSEIGTKLCDWAVGQAGAGYYSQAALSSNDSKTLYKFGIFDPPNRIYSTEITQPP